MAGPTGNENFVINNTEGSNEQESPVNRCVLSTEEKARSIFEFLRRHTEGSDFFLCLFIAALRSSTADRCLRPFPSIYIKDSNKEFQLLRNDCDKLPSVKDMLSNTNRGTDEIINLLMYMFIDTEQPILKIVKYSEVNLPGKISKPFVPNYVFSVHYSKRAQCAWDKQKDGKDTFLAYHGSRVENFYSIVKVGLQQNLSAEKVVLFGTGIYLTSEISVSANYAPFGQTWRNSMFGSKHSVIAVCEIINDQEKVKCKDAQNKRRSIVQGAFGEVPETYYVVTDSDVVRIKYLLVYKENSKSVVKSFLTNNMSSVLLILYVLMLLMVGFYNGTTWKRWWRGFPRL